MNTPTRFLPLIALAAAALGGCTTLGPMPATTGVITPAAGRPDVEANAGIVPGYYLSQATQDSAKGGAALQGGGMIEPGKLIHVPGLGVGGRYVAGSDGDGYVEPMLRYRGHLDDDKRFTGVAVAYGTHAHGAEQKADYSATRGGLELGADARVSPTSKWVEAHVFASASVTGLDASGHYCLDDSGVYGADCTDTRTPVAAQAKGVYPAGTAGLAVDFGRHLDSVFHGGRLAIMGSAGTQPRLESGTQQSARFYTSAGLMLTIGAGAL